MQTKPFNPRSWAEQPLKGQSNLLNTISIFLQVNDIEQKPAQVEGFGAGEEKISHQAASFACIY